MPAWGAILEYRMFQMGISLGVRTPSGATFAGGGASGDGSSSQRTPYVNVSRGFRCQVSSANRDESVIEVSCCTNCETAAENMEFIRFCRLAALMVTLVAGPL